MNCWCNRRIQICERIIIASWCIYTHKQYSNIPEISRASMKVQAGLWWWSAGLTYDMVDHLLVNHVQNHSFKRKCSQWRSWHYLLVTFFQTCMNFFFFSETRKMNLWRIPWPIFSEQRKWMEWEMTKSMFNVGLKSIMNLVHSIHNLPEWCFWTDLILEFWTNDAVNSQEPED